MRVLMAAGGTGGTVLPAIAVARAIGSRDAALKVLFVGTRRGFEGELVPEAGFELRFMEVGGLKGKGWGHRLRVLAQLPRAYVTSRRILKEFSPDAVFGTGGYASGPILLAAARGRFRTAILEPNAVPGFSNRLLGKLVDRVFVAFEEAKASFPAKKCILTGNPIREDILAVRPPEFEGSRRTLLVFGGSQGARRINDAVIDALPMLSDWKENLFFVHQTGVADEERVREAYRGSGFSADVFAFDSEMSKAYARSDVVLARAGSSVLEIAACGRPSILVPYPHAADDHQRANARVVREAGAAVVVEDSLLNGERLAGELKALLGDVDRLKEMSRKALTLRRDDAARSIAAELEGVGR